MAQINPPTPFDPDAPINPPSMTAPMPAPLVGVATPWAPADSENRDQILNWWRMWFKQIFFVWTADFIGYWQVQWERLSVYLNDALTDQSNQVDEALEAQKAYLDAAVASIINNSIVLQDQLLADATPIRGAGIDVTGATISTAAVQALINTTAAAGKTSM